jgi:nascent polypeptide-associated complex subunit alpha
MVKVEEVDKDAESSDEMPELQDAGDQEEGEGASPGKTGKLNRAEKKIRKTIAKLGLTQIYGIMRVTVKKSKAILFVIQKPDVWKASNSDCYLIIGEARIEDLSSQHANQAAQMMTPPPAMNNGAGGYPAAIKEEEKQIEEVEEDDDDEEVDAGDIEEKDIELVMSQVNCSRAKAVNALKNSDKDVVEAIMTLSE